MMRKIVREEKKAEKNGIVWMVWCNFQFVLTEVKNITHSDRERGRMSARERE